MIDATIDLDDYLRTLAELNEEISAYGAQRQSLGEIVSTLTELHQLHQGLLVESRHVVETSSALFSGLKEMELPQLHQQIANRYESHQQMLMSMSESLQQAVREQQRAGLEMLQNAEHTKREMVHFSERADAESATHTAYQDDIIERLRSIGSGQTAAGEHLQSIAITLESVKVDMELQAKRLQSALYLNVLILVLGIIGGVLIVVW